MVIPESTEVLNDELAMLTRTSDKQWCLDNGVTLVDDLDCDEEYDPPVSQHLIWKYFGDF